MQSKRWRQTSCLDVFGLRGCSEQGGDLAPAHPGIGMMLLQGPKSFMGGKKNSFMDWGP